MYLLLIVSGLLIRCSVRFPLNFGLFGRSLLRFLLTSAQRCFFLFALSLQPGCLFFLPCEFLFLLALALPFLFFFLSADSPFFTALLCPHAGLIHPAHKEMTEAYKSRPSRDHHEENHQQADKDHRRAYSANCHDKRIGRQKSQQAAARMRCTAFAIAVGNTRNCLKIDARQCDQRQNHDHKKENGCQFYPGPPASGIGQHKGISNDKDKRNRVGEDAEHSEKKIAKVDTESAAETENAQQQQGRDGDGGNHADFKIYGIRIYRFAHRPVRLAAAAGPCSVSGAGRGRGRFSCARR